MKKIYWLFLAPLSIFVALYFVLKIFLFPFVTDFANEKLKDLSKQNDYVEIKFEKLDFHILDPNIEVLNISIQSKKELKSILNTAKVDKINLKIDLFQLILGKLNFNLLALNEIQAEINIDSFLEGESSSKEIPIQDLYNLLAKIPIERFKFDHISLDLRSQKLNKNIRINDGLIRTSYLDQRFLIRALFKNNTVTDLKSQFVWPFEVDLNLLFSKNMLLIRQFKIKSEALETLFEGNIKNVHKTLIAPQGEITVKSQIQLESVKEIISKLGVYEFKDNISGNIKVQGMFEFLDLKNINGNIDIKSNELKYDKFDIGSANIKGDIKNNIVKLSNIDLIHPSGRVVLKNSQFNIDSPHLFKSEISSENLDLQKLFLSLNLKNIPVYLNIVPSLACEGEVKNFIVNCKGNVKAKDFVVHTEMNRKSSRIVALDAFEATGDLSIDKEKVGFKAEVSINDNVGESFGEVNFEKGFDIKFKTKSLDFKNIASLAELEFIGQLALQGNTKGDSHSATFEMTAEAKNFELEKYRLGDFSSVLNYDKGTLFFRQTKGKIQESEYKGDLDLDLLNSKISGYLNFNNAKLTNLTKIFDQTIPIPFLVEGFGNGKIDFNGPLNFWQLNYSLDADFSNVIIHKDTFQKLKLAINAKDGTASLAGTKFQKNNSHIDIDGSINSNKTFALKAKSDIFKLEESEFVKSFSSQFFGSFNFDMEVTGPVSDPELRSQVKVFDSLIGDKMAEPSVLNIYLNKNYVDFNNDMFGSKLKLKVRLPLAKQQASFIFDSQFINFDVTDLFPLIGANNMQNDYAGVITGHTNLSASDTDMQDLNGDIFIDKFYLQRGQLHISLQEPTQLVAKNGLLNLQNLILQGPDNLVEISGDDFSIDKLNIQVNAKSDLRLFHFLLPFLEELSGPFDLGAKITGSLSNLKILGQAQIKDAFLKFKNFIHPFEKIKATLVFSQSKIFIQSIGAQFAGGQVKGDGQVEIVDSKKVPVFVKLKGENLSLNVPDRVSSSGNAELVFSGQWFPFTLSGTYNVIGGVFEKEFNDENATSQAHQSIYLPKNIKEKNFEPFVMDILINLENKYLIKNSQVDGYVTGSLQLKGPPGNSILLGKLEIEKAAKLYFKDKIFELQTGLVNFTNPTEINPELYITASSRVNDYDINLLLQGPAKTSAIKMTSVPPLAENEIISLLALGVTSARLEQNVQSKDQAAQTGYEIGAQVLSQSAITKNLKNRLGLDIQFVNQFDSTKNISVLKATVSKKITNKIQATASRSLGNEANSEVKLQYLFNKNVSAIGNWEGKEVESVKTNEKESQSVFGLDLEFKREFR